MRIIVFNSKILTSARNGELIMWDLNKSGVTKYGTCPFLLLNKYVEFKVKNEEQRTISVQFTRCPCHILFITTALRDPRMVICVSGYVCVTGCSQEFHALSGPAGILKVYSTCAPPDCCPKPRLFAQPLAAFASCSWSGQWKHIQVGFENGPTRTA